MGEWTEKAPTCTEDGFRKRECVVCNKVEKQDIKATGHSFDKEEICVVCGAKQSDDTIKEDNTKREVADNQKNTENKRNNAWIWWLIAAGMFTGIAAGIIFIVKNKKMK